MLCRRKSERFQKYTHLQILVHLGVQKLVMPFCRTGNIPGPLHFWVFGIEARSDLADPKKKKKFSLLGNRRVFWPMNLKPAEAARRNANNPEKWCLTNRIGCKRKMRAMERNNLVPASATEHRQRRTGTLFSRKVSNYSINTLSEKVVPAAAGKYY